MEGSPFRQLLERVVRHRRLFRPQELEHDLTRSGYMRGVVVVVMVVMVVVVVLLTYV